MTKILHILTRDLDDNDQILISAWQEAGETREVRMQDDPVDYAQVVDLIFEYDKTIVW